MTVPVYNETGDNVQIPIEDIIIKKRVRNDSGDLAPLVESLRRFGLIHPVLINKRNVLIAGYRRLSAAQQLGWRTINAMVVDAKDELTKLELELEENVQRRDLDEAELSKAYSRLQKLRNPSWLRRLWTAIVHFFKRLFGIQD